MAVNTFTGATDSNWGTATNWSQGTVPTASDTHTTTFDASSPNCTVNNSNRLANNLTFVGYTNTITMTFGISVSGNVTLGTEMIVAGTGALTVNATSTLTSNGVTWPNTLIFGGVITATLVGNWSNTGLVTAGAATIINKTTTETFTCAGGYTFGTSSSNNTGTAEIILTGGTYTPSTSTGVLQNNLTFAGNVTISSSQVFRYSTGTLKYTSGTITTTGATLTCSASTTLNTNGITWNNVTLSGAAAVFTLTSNLTCTGLLTTSASTNSITINRTTAETITTSGGLTQGGSTSTVAGTAEIIVTGGTITGPTSSGTFSSNLTLAGNVTFLNGGTFPYRTGTLKYTSGTITTTGHTLACGASTTFDCAGVTWNNLTLTGGSTFTLTGNLNVSGTLTIGSGASNVVINGAQLIPTGSVSVANGTGTVLGTGTIKYTNTQTLTKTSTGAVGCNQIVDAAGKTVTFVGDWICYLGHLNCIAGTVITDTATWATFGSGSGGGLIFPRAMNGGYSA